MKGLQGVSGNSLEKPRPDPSPGRAGRAPVYLFVQTKKKIQKWVGIMNNTKVKDKDLPKMGKLCILHLYMLF